MTVLNNVHSPAVPQIQASSRTAVSDRLAARLMEAMRSPDYRPPTLPAAAAELMALRSGAGEFDVSRLKGLLEKDMMLAGRMMHIAQSPAYTTKIPVQSLHEALVRLGDRTVFDLVFEAFMQLRVFQSKSYAAGMKMLQHHSTATAHITRIVCLRAGVPSQSAFLSGLLHDVGLAGCLLLLDSGRKRCHADQAWAASVAAHGTAGVQLAQLWGLPEEIVDAVGNHHQPCAERPLRAAVALADRIAEEIGRGSDAALTEGDLCDMLGLDEEARADIVSDAEAILANVG